MVFDKISCSKQGITNGKGWAFLEFLAGRATEGLDFIAADQTGHIAVGDPRSGETTVNNIIM